MDERTNQNSKTACSIDESIQIEEKQTLHAPQGHKIMKLKLSIEVIFEPNDVPKDILKKMLAQIAHHANEDGLFVGHTAARVKFWRYEVTEPDSVPPKKKAPKKGAKKFDKKYMEFCGTEKFATKNAYLILGDGSDEDFWIPKSQVQPGSRRELGQNETNPDWTDCSYMITEWIAQQITEAFPWGDDVPRYLIRDRDAVYGEAVTRRLRALGIRDKPIAPGSPWQNTFAERIIGTIRRECVDHVIALGERHLRQILKSYAKYYNSASTHRSLGMDAPVSRPVQQIGRIVSQAMVGGLHRRYVRI